MPIPPYVADLRSHIGHDLLWLPGVTAVVRRGTGPATEVLLVRRSDDGTWTPVTGIVDPGEEPAVAAAREALEEADVVIRVDRLALVGATDEVAYPNGDRSVYLDLTFACTWVSGEARVADDESTDVRWCTPDELEDLRPAMAARMRARIDAALSGESAARFATG
ncbi:NUDIX hydrolase [Nocardioides aurantiacus]|uniref:ADP-ribose pyrophosphatase YjhB (NUDIX family) n=1 Tax=Nocardioides aurantiacus TaxID=86796 RepID=A0A3N2CYQ0_9ACTN|nr:NUDIX domain-containing protein [Nocardioides aurantiacus]ROR92583.1 ADP-ribose pyrophosphatase YjhB (NUDIX family) [Nocardioides aurantiacus]